jgi:hypothetical protein
MAGAGAKKRLQDNQNRLQTLRLAAGTTTFLYVAIRWLLFRSSTYWYHWLGLTVTVLVHAFAYLLIASVAKPVYSPSGELQDGGADLNKHTAASYSHDVLYITSFVQVLAAFTNYGWLAYLTIPAYALFKLWALVIYPNFFAPKKEEKVDPDLMKRMERADKRAERRRMKRF